MKYFSMLAVLLAAMTFVLTDLGSAHAQVYRWTDENGKVHFGDKPPPNQQAEDISSVTKAVNVDESKNEQGKLSNIFAPETEEEKRLKQQASMQAQQRKQAQQEQCSEARRLLKMITEERFYGIDEDGNEFDVSMEEAQQERNELQKFLEKNC